MTDSAIDILVVDLTRLMNSNFRLFFDDKDRDQISSLCKQLESLRSFLNNTDMKHHKHKKVKNLVNRIIELAHKADDIINLWVVNSVKPKKRYVSQRISKIFYPDSRVLQNIITEMASIMAEVSTIDNENTSGIGDPQVGMPFHGSTSGTDAPNVEEDVVVGFGLEAEMIKEQLAGGTQHLEVISIVGMAGLGKTTLARKLYNDPLIVYHFYVRGWTSVSQVYRKKDLLLDILSSIVDHKDEVAAVSEDKLEEELYRRLKGNRYLMVMDDIWEIDAWDELKRCFPNDNNGSRILFTSRVKGVALSTKLHTPPHLLRFLTADESWDLLRLKVFRKESCPLELTEVGREITRKCMGLPLAIVVVAGLLAQTDKTLDWWRTVVESISSHIASSPQHCMDTLALSYDHLPHHLKPCFIYFGAFPEDCEIPVRKLIWLWIAEGFIKPTGVKKLEDVAEEYLVDLINRNLVLAAKRRSTSGIRSCRIHDLLRDLCLRKAKEDKFLKQIYCHEDAFSACFASSSPSARPQACGHVGPSLTDKLSMCLPFFKEASNSLCSKSAKQDYFSQQTCGSKDRRLCIQLSHATTSAATTSATTSSAPSFSLSSSPSYSSSAPQVRSLLCFATEWNRLFQNTMSFSSPAFQLLRVLDLSAIGMHAFPGQILHLVLLRYLALRGKNLWIPTSISNLWNLETLCLSEGMGTELPPELLYLPQLRHLCVAGENHLPPCYSFLPVDLQTLSQVVPSIHCEDFLNRARNLRKLVFCGNFVVKGKFWFPDLYDLKYLESLKFLNRTRTVEGDGLKGYGQGYNLEGLRFPTSVKRLTLSLTYLDWSVMSTLGMLPNLEALKLEYQACVGPRWDTSDGGFRQLKYLKLYYINIVQWNACRTHFPSLQHLVLHKCERLEEIPFEFGNIHTLHTIDVNWCSPSTVFSARQIQEEQHSNGNDWPQVSIYPPDWEPQPI